MDDDLKEAQELYTEAVEALRAQRKQIREDLAFSDPSDPQQWDETVKSQRETDPGGARPCLVMDHTGQYVDNVAGQVAKSPPGMHVAPVDSGGDKRVAEQLDGLFRHVEYSSRAQMHYTTALRSAARAGVGYLVIRPEYVNRAMNYQEPRISAEPDALRVVFDPWCMEPDGKDANFGYVLTPLSHREFERKYGKKTEKISFGTEEVSKDDKESILVAEQWYAEEKTETMVIYMADDEETAVTEADFITANEAQGGMLQPLRTYKDKRRCVKWRQMSGLDIFEESEYPADQIGIVPVYGYWSISEGKMLYCGIPRRAMPAQRAYNYHQSELAAYMGTAPKAPWMVPVRALRGLESLWDRASVDTRAYLPYHDVDDLGNPIAAPTRPSVSTNLQNHLAGADQALRDLEASIGMYQANLGAPSNETSRVAIDGRKESGETSTSHFPLNLAASLGQVGRICLQMIPRLIDTRRQVRILGVDMSPGFVTVDPKQQQALQETPKGISINPNVGSYDVRVVIGTAYSTQRSQAQAALGEVMRTNPEMTPAIAPLWAMNLDIPNAEKLSQVLASMAPPAVQAILNPDASKQPQTAELVQQVEDLKKAIEEAISHAHDAQAEADEANDKLRDKAEEIKVAQFKADTERLKVTGANDQQIQAIVSDLLNNILSDPESPAAPLMQHIGGIQQQVQELASKPEPEPPAPQEFPELQQIMAQLQQISEQQGLTAQQNEMVSGDLQKVAAIMSKKRIRIPERDKSGSITRVIDQMEE